MTCPACAKTPPGLRHEVSVNTGSTQTHTMKRIFLLTLILFSYFQSVNAQGIAITADNTDPDASAILDVKSHTKGFLLPRMTEAQKKAITAPASGLIIFQTDAQKGLYVFDGAWKPLTDQLGNHLATENLRLGGFRLSNTDTTVGISIDEKGAVRFRAKPQTGEPVNRFLFDPSGAIISNGIPGEGILPAYGEGARFMWYPGKAALRAGKLETDKAHFWSEDSIGLASVAIGNNNTAAGSHAISFGSSNSSKGESSFGIGQNNKSYGLRSVCIGHGNEAGAEGTMALGRFNQLEGRFSIGIGTTTSSATGTYSILLGTDVRSNHSGCLIMGDRSGAATLSTSASNQFSAKFSGGFLLYSSAILSTGVSLAPNSNAWSIISDSARKEKFLPANGEELLTKLRPLKMGSWNYKGIPQRHYGPMAQEFFAAYGKDQFGIIGNDTTINQADMEGVMMILIHALESRTSTQQDEINRLRQTNTALLNRISATEEQLKKLDLLLALMKNNDGTRLLITQLEAACHSNEKSCCEK
jgi:hypothetical protein